MKRLTSILIALFCLISFKLLANPGDTCTNPISFGYGDTICQSSILNTGSFRWYSFIANSNTVNITVTSLTGNPNSVNSIALYTFCNASPVAVVNTTRIGQDTIVLTDTNLVQRQNYYVLITTSSLTASTQPISYSFCMLNNRPSASSPLTSIIYRNTDCGLNYALSSIALHGRYNPADAPYAQRHFGNGVFTIAGIPTGASILAAYVLYAVVNVDNNAPYAPVNFNLNGTPFTSTSMGTLGGSTCWEYNTLCMYEYDGIYCANNLSIFNIFANTESYKANVTSAITGNGTYTITTYPTGPVGLPQYNTLAAINTNVPGPGCTPSCNTFIVNPPPPWVFSNSGLPYNYNDVDGATLVVIYKDPSATYKGTFSMNGGALGNNMSGNTTFTASFPSVPTCATNESAFAMVGDVESPGDRYQINTAPSNSFSSSPNAADLWNTPIVNNAGVLGTGGTISVNIISGGDCIDMFAIGGYYQTPLPTVSLSANPTSVCPGQPVVLTATVTNGCTPPYTFTWNPGNIVTVGTNTITVTPTVNTTYSVEIDGCSNIGTVAVNMFPVPNFTINGPVDACNATNTYSVTPVQANTTYLWNNSSTGTTFPIPATDVPNGGIITCVGTNQNGCSTTETFTVFPCCNVANPFGNINIADQADCPIPAGLPPAFITGSCPTYTVNTFNTPIAINGTFTITTGDNITFTNSQIGMGPDARILIQPGATLTLDNTHVFAGCGYMWDAIILSDATSTLNIQNNSLIEDGQHAVLSLKGGVYTITNSTFNKNLISVRVKPYNLRFKGTIANGTFEDNACLLPPYAGRRSQAGVDIIDVRDITVGANVATGNSFDNMDYGIIDTMGTNSIANLPYRNDLLVKGNTFSNINNANNPCTINAQAAIFCYNLRLNSGGVYVGDNSGSGFNNTFTSCINGVHIQGIIDTADVVNGNIFNGIDENGVWIENIGRTARFPSVINVTKNNITMNVPTSGFNKGVFCFMNKFVTGNILSNTISAIHGSGIVMSEFSRPTTAIYNANNNNIPNCWVDGIEADNLYKATINSNVIFIPTPNLSIPISSGIYLQGDELGLTKGNVITSNTYSTHKFFNFQPIGVWEQSNIGANTIECNGTSDIAVGFQSDGLSSTGVHYWGNSMTKENYGFFQSTALLPFQGSGSQANYNSWTNPFAPSGCKVKNNINVPSSLIFFWAGNPAFYHPAPAFICDAILGGTVFNPSLASLFPCPAIGPPPPHAFNVNFLESVAKGKAQFSSIHDTALNISRHGLFISATDSALNTDTIIRHFADSIKVASMGRLVIMDSIVQANPDTIQFTLANSINPANNIEDHLQKLLPVYLRLNLWQDSLAAGDTNLLRSVAKLCPYIDGYGVLEARAILRRFDKTVYVNSCETYAPANGPSHEKDNRLEENNLDTITAFNLYPNPNSGSMTLTYAMQQGDEGKVFIYDMLGKELYVNKLDPAANNMNIRTNLDNGVYIYNITINNQMAKTGKVVIIH